MGVKFGMEEGTKFHPHRCNVSLLLQVSRYLRLCCEFNAVSRVLRMNLENPSEFGKVTDDDRRHFMFMFLLFYFFITGSIARILY